MRCRYFLKLLTSSLLLISIYFTFCGADSEPIIEWQLFEAAVRDGSVSKKEAVQNIEHIMKRVSAFITYNFSIDSAKDWVFPIKGYTMRSLDKSDFNPSIKYGPYGVKGYNFFDGNRHGGHPAYDIFIRDKDQDSLDDRTLKPAEVAAMTDCAVLSINDTWDENSRIRGGKYIWLFDPTEELFIYYAHLKDIFVKPGELVRRGSVIGTVGRTGFLANKKTSPTHIHLMVLEFNNGSMTPYDYYDRISN